MALEFDHSVAGHCTVPAHPAKYSLSPVADGKAAPLLPPPMLGEHTEETLTELLGFSTDEVELLEDEGVVSCWKSTPFHDFDVADIVNTSSKPATMAGI